MFKSLPSILLLATAISAAVVGTKLLKQHSPMSIEEATRLKFRVSVSGVGFDVPVNYHHQDFELLKEWPRPPDSQLRGQERTPVDYIRIHALLPDMDGYTANNAVEFDRLGYGRKVSVSLTDRHRVDWKYYFNLVGPRLQRLPDSIEAPRMIHYFDTSTQDDVYLSHNYPNSKTVRIVCSKPAPRIHPVCTVTTRYMDDRFHLEYSFGLSYLSQWLDIDQRLRVLFDQFAMSAKKQ